ncbi:MAG: phosphoenolpyruvate hydrolase family protein [Planctomycetota bacterium]|nr:phosphoenolpyruvate hydrolase family protein [Planctomycetota bacterium]
MSCKRQEMLVRFHAMRTQGVPIVGGGAGTGLSAKAAEAGGIDLLVIYNSGKFRMAGRGSLAGMMPYGNANEIVVELGREVLTVVKHTPVLAGVCGTDPFLLRDHFLDQLAAMGFAGIQNFPTVGLIDGTFRQNLEETDMGYDKEIDLIAAAHRKNMFTSPYAFNPDEARAMALAGADMVVAHMGLTTAGSIGAKTARTLEDCVRDVGAIVEAAKSARADCLAICHGGPIAEPEDARFILARVKACDGFYGASSMERLPTERAIRDQVRAFKEGV